MNKYANEYLNSLTEALKKTPAIIPAGIALGSLVGGVEGLQDPGVDEKGNPKSKVKAVLKQMATGGALGGAVGTGLAVTVPGILDRIVPSLRTRAIRRMPESGWRTSEWLNSPKKWMMQLDDTMFGGPGSVSFRNKTIGELINK